MARLRLRQAVRQVFIGCVGSSSWRLSARGKTNQSACISPKQARAVGFLLGRLFPAHHYVVDDGVLLLDTYMKPEKCHTTL